MLQLVKFLIMVLSSLAVSVGGARGATLGEEIATAGDGWLRFSYPLRLAAINDSDNIYIGDGFSRDSEGPVSGRDGLVHVALRLRHGEPRRLKLRGGCGLSASWRDMRDLGEVTAAEAVAYILPLTRGADEELAENAVAAAALADTCGVWPELVALARDDRRPDEVREAAVFWLGQAAGDKVTEDLAALVEDDDLELGLREHAVFALSQSLADDGVPMLSRIALKNPHPQLRRSALFWLAQVDDPAVVDLFEEILTR